MPENKHVFLNNQQADKPKFNRQRGRDNNSMQTDAEEEIVVQPKSIQEFQKEKLRHDKIELYTRRKFRNSNRSIEFSDVIDLVRIYFFSTFNDNLKGKFFSIYGLSPVEYSHFNKTVMFEVVDGELFKNFHAHLQEVIDSDEGTSYEGQPFGLIALILQFDFIGTRGRICTTNESGLLLTLISSANKIYTEQKGVLFNYLKQEKVGISYSESSPDIIEVSNLTRKQRALIAGNFDIVKVITSTRTLKIRPGVYGTSRRDFGFNVTIPDNLTTVGIIDTGVTSIEPLRNLIVKHVSYDHTGHGAFWDEEGHGTLVAGLVVLGDDFHREVKNNYIAKAKIAVIKTIHNANDPIDIPKLLNDIKDAKRKHGIRLFNMSLNIPFAKNYNSPYSQFAYELDKLAFEEDILIFISVGNIDGDYINDMTQVDTHPDHDYPTFFYKLETTSSFHSCRNTNISEPAESLNNISIGALAGNLEDGDSSDITPNSLSPAYYSRKFHFDYSQPVNNTPIQKNTRNKHLNKPDMVFEGGDLFDFNAGIEILRSPMADGEKYFGRTCGTSLSTPLITSYAAEILNTYPTLRTQTVKALLINASSYFKRSNLPDFKTSTDTLLKSMTGFGKPQKKDLLFTDNNSITFIVEKEIRNEQILCIPINLPDYLKQSDNKLKFDVTICYSFMPVKDNHLNYLPMHMSVNLMRNVDMDKISKGTQKDYGIKNSFSWSEDHFGLENCLFSNAQFISRNLQASDIIDVNGSIMLGVRCLVKTEIPEMQAYATTTSHPFSVVIKVTELPEIKASNQLYTEMIACNEIIVINDATGEIEIEAEA